MAGRKIDEIEVAALLRAKLNDLGDKDLDDRGARLGITVRERSRSETLE